MDKAITIRGKEYKAKFVSLLLFQKYFALTRKVEESEKAFTDNPEQAEEGYKKAWLNLCGAMLDGDVSGLGVEALTPEEVLSLTGFFSSAVAEMMPKSKSGLETSEDSSQKEK